MYWQTESFMNSNQLNDNKSIIFLLAIRSGDYYMFDELDDDELDLLPEETREDDEQSDMPTMGEVSKVFFLFVVDLVRDLCCIHN